jgi:integrase
MLITYRRHLKKCEHRSEGRKYRRCKCPIWLDGFLSGEEVRRALRDPERRDTVRDWQRAQDIVRDMEATGKNPADTRTGPTTLEDATNQFIADAKARGLRKPTIYKYDLLFRQLKDFAERQDIRFVSELDAETLSRFRVTWPNRNLGALKKLEYLRSFFRFVHDNGWMDDNPARKLKSPKVSQRPTMPFTPEEMVRVLSACDRFGSEYQGERRAKENARRMRSLILLLRHSGLRIRDAVTISRDRITGDKLFLYTAKTGTPVYLPLPASVIQALDALPNPSCKHFFWTGESSPEAVTKNWQKNLKEVFRLAGIPDGHAHRFRDTFAVDLLMARVPMERVSVLLGHASVRVTEKHYAPWVRARQEQLEADVRGAWAAIESQMKGTQEVHEKKELVN